MQVTGGQYFGEVLQSLGVGATGVDRRAERPLEKVDPALVRASAFQEAGLIELNQEPSQLAFRYRSAAEQQRRRQLRHRALTVQKLEDGHGDFR
jgi:hypothetical protein